MESGLPSLRSDESPMNTILQVVYGVATMCLSSACVQPRVVTYTETSAQTFALTDAQVANFKAKALNRGDVSAALRLEMFYSMTVGDRAESLRWMKLAARLGDDGAIAYLKAEGINLSN